MAGQNKIGWNKLVAAVVLSAFLIVTGLLFIVPKVSADGGGSYSWKNASTISVTGYPINQSGGGASDFDFTCSGSGTKYTCTTSSTGICHTSIDINGASNTGKLNYSTLNARTGTCLGGGSSTIDINDTENAPAGLTDGSDPNGGDGTSGGVDPTLECHVGINPLTWFICPIVKGVNLIIGQLDNAITSLLTVDQKAIFDTSTATGKGYYGAWQTFRGFAVAILIISGLVMVIAQALGFEILDTYTIKKILPRLIFAVLGIALSWQIMEFFVMFTNDVGIGIRQIIYYPFRGIDGAVQLGNGASLGLLIVGGGAFAALGLVGLFSFVMTGVLAVAIAFLVLIVRQLVIVVLILIAPIAIACSILPNTQGVYKLWHESFTKAMMMFPIIVAFIAVGRVFAVTSIGSDISKVPAISQLIGFGAYFLPYFLIPLTFRFAGGALRTIGGSINDRNRGGFDRLKKFRQGKTAHNMQGMKNFSRFSENTRMGRGANNILGAGFNTSSLAQRRSGVRARRNALQGVQGAGFMKENEVFQANANDDNFLLAVANRGMAKEKLAKSQEKFENATTVEERNEALADISARKKGLDAAMQIPMGERNTRAVKMGALGALARSGYQFSTGKDGYQELSQTVDSIVGSDQGAKAATMDEMQYHLKNAGRFDLGGINHGAGYSLGTGMDKSSGYTAGNAKSNTFEAGLQEYLHSTTKSRNPTTGKMETIPVEAFSRDLSSRFLSGDMKPEEITSWHAKLLDSEPGAIGGNKTEIIRQRTAIESMLGAVNNAPTPTSDGTAAGDSRTAAEFKRRKDLIEGISGNTRRSRMNMDPNLLEDKK